MIAELGHFALILALGAALVQCALPLLGAARNHATWMNIARPATQLQAVLVVASYAALTWSFATNDFSVRYVAANSNVALPLAYRVAAVWGGHEGSMLLWTLMLALWSLAVSLAARRMPAALSARVLAVLGGVSTGFLLFLLFASNPFIRLLPPAMDGRDLNPLLQDPGMVFHPPLLYMGYVGFAVTYAFAVAALLSGRFDSTWARLARPWTTLAWSFLTLGIMLGSAWAYYELGWGGWWFWDPVENASFMPWLAGTALIHSFAVTEKRGTLRAWTLLLAIATFSLSLLGTFLVRSGVLTSVHAFAVDPRRGVFILALLGIVTGGALALYAWRAPRVQRAGQPGKPVALASREIFLLTNNVLLGVAAATVLLGTLYPLLLDVLDLGRISVGPAYFEEVFVPLMAPMVLLLGAAPLARWHGGTFPELAVRLRWSACASLAIALGLLLVLRNPSAMTGLGLLLATWCVTTAVSSLLGRLRHPGQRLLTLRQLPPSYYGMLLAHAGVGMFIAGVTLVSGQETLRELPMRAGDTVEAGGYTFRFDGVTPLQGPNYEALQGTLVASRDGRTVSTLTPERRIYRTQDMPTTEAAIDTGFTRDLYVALGESIDDHRWAVRVHVKPFVNWIWIGCTLMAAGGLLAVADRRYRLRQVARAGASAQDEATMPAPLPASIPASMPALPAKELR